MFGFLDKDIKKLIESKTAIKCCFCSKGVATIICAQDGCNATFHLPCALKKGCIPFFTGDYGIHCPLHTKKPDISVSREELNTIHCVICLEKLTRSDFSSEILKVLRTPCCKRNFLHLECAQKHATTSGYFTKCPICSNTENFQGYIKQYGVFVPHRDYAWEMRNNRTFDFSYDRSCNAEECKCPRGRNFANYHGPWSYKDCMYCGSNTMHLSCAEQPYVCDICSAVNNTGMFYEQYYLRIILINSFSYLIDDESESESTLTEDKNRKRFGGNL